MPSTTQIAPRAIKLEAGNNTMSVQWSDGHLSAYPYQYLRDRCPCATCSEMPPAPPAASPAAVPSACPENNTVYAEYYRPTGEGRFPGVIVLDITAGDQRLSRIIADCLAQNGVAALFVQMGSLLGDMLWAALAITGTALLIGNRSWLAILGIVGGCFLLRIAYGALHDAWKPRLDVAAAGRRGGDFATGAAFSAAVLGPSVLAALGLGSSFVPVTARAAAFGLLHEETVSWRGDKRVLKIFL